MKQFLFVLALMILPIFAQAAPLKTEAVGFEWQMPNTIDVQGYYLYWKTPTGSFNDTDRVKIVGAVNKSVLSTALPAVADGAYVAAATAYGTNGNESGYSEVLGFRMTLGKLHSLATAPVSPTNLILTPKP